MGMKDGVRLSAKYPRNDAAVRYTGVGVVTRERWTESNMKLIGETQVKSRRD